MSTAETLEKFRQELAESLVNHTLVKLSMGNYQGNDKELKNLYVKEVTIKRKPMLSFNYRYKTRDIFKNLSIEDGLKLIMNFLSNDFKIGTLFTITTETIIECDKKHVFKLRQRELQKQLASNQTHDKIKQRLIKSSANGYLHQLKITDDKGVVYKNAQDKYKQINHYIEILSSLIKELPEGTIKNVVDMGAGKGYLTFALYDYLQNQQKNVAVTGVEFRKDMVDLCNDIAKKTGFERLNFVEGTIESYNQKDMNLLIALHACDTATDDAIFKGIKADAELIVVAPCCHKQIRKEIEKNKIKNDVSFLTKYGIFLERQSEMVTDGIRALILEYFGYKTKVFEFISDAHTPKNVLVVGIKSKKLKVKSEGLDVVSEGQKAILQKIKDAKAYFGISYHHLERLLEL